MVAVVLALAGGPPGEALHDGPEASWRELTPNLGWLLAGSVLAAALVERRAAGRQPPGHRRPSNPSSARFNAGVLVARVPLFLFQAVQAALLPKLARLAAVGLIAEFRRGFRRLLQAVIMVGALGTIGAFLHRPVRAAGALRQRRSAAAPSPCSPCPAPSTWWRWPWPRPSSPCGATRGWPSGGRAGMAAFVLVTAVAGDDLLLRVELGLIAGSSLALVVFAIVSAGTARAGCEPDEDSLVEALHDLPLRRAAEPRPVPSAQMTLTVAADTTPLLGQRTGIGTLVASLVDELDQRDDVELLRYAVSMRAPVPAGVRRFPYPARVALRGLGPGRPPERPADAARAPTSSTARTT